MCFLKGLFDLDTGENGGTNSCTESSDGAAWTMIVRESWTVRGPNQQSS